MTRASQDPLLAAVSSVLDEPLTSERLVEVLRARRMNFLARGLHARIARCGDPRDAHACLQAIDALSEAAAARLLRSPALCECLRFSGSDARLRALLELEEPVAPQDVWSALGDVWSGHDAPSPGLERSHDGRWYAPRLRCGLPLDLSLPAALAHPDAGLQRPRALDPAEQLAALTRLDRAVECLHPIAPLGHDVFTELTSNLVLRVDEARPDECWGASSGVAIGRIAVINPAAAHDDAALAEVLLHEAVHCTLDCAELEQTLAVLDADTFALKVRSPWTGAPIDPHAFAHASVVWAVLLRFWTEYAARHPEHEHARARSRFIRRGFATGDLQATLSMLGPHLTPAAPEVIARAWAAARRDPADPG